VVPRQADCFQQRAAMSSLWDSIAFNDEAAPCQVITGLGGVGKTQLAANYARSLWAAEAIDLLLWITADSRHSVITGYGRAGVEITGADSGDLEESAARFLNWAETTDRQWLVVLDDVTDPADMRGLWLPTHRGCRGRAVITTRRRDAALYGPGRQRLDLGLFTVEEASTYLARSFIAHGSAVEPEQIDGLIDDLGYLPLALAQALAYMVDMGSSCAAYRKRLADSNRTLLDLFPEESSLPDDQDTSVAATWLLSIARANKLRPKGLALPLLELASMLDPNGFPLTVLTTPSALVHLAQRRHDGAEAAGAAASMGEPASDAMITEHEVRSALRSLHRLSLADQDTGPSGDIVRVHALIQRVTRESVSCPGADALARVCADSLLHIWPDVARDSALARLLRANTETLASRAGSSLWEHGCHDILMRSGTSLGECGMPHLASEYFSALLVRAEGELGPSHADTLFCRHHCAWWRGVAGDPTGAVSASLELVDDLVITLGPEHPDTLAVRNSLAYWRGVAGDQRGAASATESLVVDLVRVLGPEHPETLAARSAYAWWLGITGELATATHATGELLADLVRVLGPDHPDTLATRANRARWLGAIDSPTRAVSELRELLADLVRVLGPDHPDTLAVRGGIARLLGVAGDPSGAANAFADVLVDRLRVLGPDHPDTFTTRSGLARWRGVAGDPSGAVDALDSLLADRIRVLGADHPDTLATRNGLAWWRGEAGEPAVAAAEFAILVVDLTRVLGPQHADTVAARKALAHWEAPDDPNAAHEAREVRFPVGARRPRPLRSPRRLR
jgi:hypothetical protein